MSKRLFVKLVSSIMVLTMSFTGVAAYDRFDDAVVISADDFDYVDGFVPPTFGLGGFVTRLYRRVLGRNPDRAGFNYWYDLLATKTLTGKALAEQFFTSPEFQNIRLTQQEYIELLYEVFFDRAPDAAGLAFWNNEIYNKGRKVVREEFYYTKEWVNICDSYGIEPGVPRYSQAIIDFVTRLYQECCGRNPDKAGLDWWCKRLDSGIATGKKAVYDFMTTNEFRTKAYALDNEEFVALFYRVFFGREPLIYYGEGSYWLALREYGAGIAEFFDGFEDSVEFEELCMEAGIEPGPHIDVGARQLNVDEEFVNYLGYYSVQRGMNRLSSVVPGARRTSYTLYNVQSATTSSRVVQISSGDIDAIQRFANSHFQSNWSPAKKVAYTLYWIHKNVDYATGSGWNAISGLGYAQAIFDRHLGQCAQYNGALIEMMCWLGYDANLILGWRGSSNSNRWQHYWGEVTISGTTYLMEAGEKQWPGWYYLCATYSETSKYIKNNVVMG